MLFGASDYTSRVSAAIFGSALVLTPLLLRRKLGVVGTLAAMAFLAFSPTLVYYSRFFREDIYLTLFTLLMVVAMWRYIEEGRDRWLILLAGSFLAGILTKEGGFITTAVFLVYLDLYLAANLATQTLIDRQNWANRDRSGEDDDPHSAPDIGRQPTDSEYATGDTAAPVIEHHFPPGDPDAGARTRGRGRSPPSGHSSAASGGAWAGRQTFPAPATCSSCSGPSRCRLLTPVSRHYLLEPLGRHRSRPARLERILPELA